MSFLIDFFRCGKRRIDTSLLDSTKKTSPKEKPLKNPVKNICADVMLEVFSFLSAMDLVRCRAVNKEWQKITTNESLGRKVFRNTFGWGKEKWKNVEAEPLLPLNLEKILISPCPYFPPWRVYQTHILVLIPKTNDGKPYNFRSVTKLKLKDPEKVLKTDNLFEYIWKKYGNDTVEKSQWVLMTKNVIPESRNRSYAEQQRLVAQNPYYCVPRILEAMTCILIEYEHTGIRRFSAEHGMPWAERTVTRCEESLNGWQIVLGNFLPSGLKMDCHEFNNQSIGVAALRRL